MTTSIRLKAFFLNVSFGFAVTAILLLAIELACRAFIPNDIARVARIAPPDRGSEILLRNGYRGRRPCRECPANQIRVVTMGGSSTFGIPMHYGSKTYSAILDRILKERRPHENYEVLNGGIPGFGIWQIIESLERVVVKDKPDILILCAWFNDSSFTPGWYGYQGLSDYEAFLKVRRLRDIESNAIYQILENSRLFGTFRYLLTRTLAQVSSSAQAPPKRRKRTSPAEFMTGLEHIARLAAEHDFQLILLFEPLNRTARRSDAVKKNKYYSVMEAFSARTGIPIVDSLTPLAERHGEWFFYDFIHPNEHGHEAIAEAVYASLFDPKWHTPVSREFFEKKGVTIQQ